MLSLDTAYCTVNYLKSAEYLSIFAHVESAYSSACKSCCPSMDDDGEIAPHGLRFVNGRSG